MKNSIKDLCTFLKNSKTQYHAVSELSKKLDEEGFIRLYEHEPWELSVGQLYYTVRDGSSLIAWRNTFGGFMISAAHTDSPCFRVKGSVTSGAYVKLETEKYGGMINYTWLDRPLTVAGRLALRTEKGIIMKLCDIGKTELVIPSLAIHMNRNVNESLKLNPAVDLLPLASLAGGADVFELAAKSVGAKKEEIVAHELFLVSAEEPRLFGTNGEFILSPRLDDLASVYAAFDGFMNMEAGLSTPVFAVFDNEEVGSETKQGAASTFLRDTLRRISESEEHYLERLGSSFMISADNAHAIHPNHPEVADKSNAPVLGGGVVVKYNANQRYATDALSDGLLRRIAEGAGVKLQSYFNRADLPGGSTLGSISDTRVSVPTVDIGLPQLAMHSANESMAAKDFVDMKKLFSKFFGSTLYIEKNCISVI